MRLIQAVENVIHEKGPYPAWLAGVLWFLALCYRLAVWLRNMAFERGWFRSYGLPCKAISVGNLTVGGTGKTPMTIYLARLARQMGYRVAVISRGYGGSAGKRGPAVVADGRTALLTAQAAGDEPALMAALLPGIPVIVGADRVCAGRLAIDRFQTQVLVLDDAFQHRRLRRDIDLVLLDYRRPLGNGKLLPRGPLREPATALQRASVVIYTRTPSDPMGAPPPVIGHAALPRFTTWHRPVIRGLQPAGAIDWVLKATDESLKRRRVVIFSGIADNDGFCQTIEDLGAQVQKALAFKDHHRYTPADMLSIATAAKESSAEFLVTTEKDHSRLRQAEFKLTLPLMVIGIEISFGEKGAAFSAAIADLLSH